MPAVPTAACRALDLAGTISSLPKIISPESIATMMSLTKMPPKGKSSDLGLFKGDWQDRLAAIVDAMREMSLQTDAAEMVRSYATRVRRLLPASRWLSVSRRELESPWYRITRSSTWTESIDPWKQKDRLPLLKGGLLADLIYGDEPRLIDDITPLLAHDDPAFEYLAGFRSLMAAPHFDQGVALNMVVTLQPEPAAFDPETFPEWYWVSSLFGRATHNLVLKEEKKQAFEIVERELNLVAQIQRLLLPQVLPKIPGFELAAYYRTSQWAGGDYYDFFPLPDGRWGILIADVSGHGTPAAVMMAITHSLAHSLPGPADPPASLLGHVNRQLRNTTPRPTRSSSRPFMAFTTRRSVCSLIPAPATTRRDSSGAAMARSIRSRKSAVRRSDFLRNSTTTRRRSP